MDTSQFRLLGEALSVTDPMPVLFVGHGSPINAIEDNQFSRAWRYVGERLSRPRAILCISAHWQTLGVLVTAMEQPRTIHDFGGFPPELYRQQYPAPGSSWLAETTREVVGQGATGLDQDWGLDHGCWSVLKQMFPGADVPVVQLSLDRSKAPQAHYDLARSLASLRRKGVLILGSGNMVHNLRRIHLVRGSIDDVNQPFGFDWAIEASELIKKHIGEQDHAHLIDYPSLGKAVLLAVPTSEHYLPMLYALALQEQSEEVYYFNDVAVGGSVTMTSFVIS